MDAFSPIPALVGGALIGLASAVLWLGNGRIAGISGVFGQLLPPARTVLWRLVFLVSLVLGTLAAAWLLPGLGLGVGGPAGAPAELVSAPAGWGVPTPLWLAVAGLLTGFGTKIGNGCTSGHGVCGIARLSTRSFVAVGIFFSVAILTVAATGVV
ncbi:YeeE/YedE family protein [Devosia sp.]|uniref:YeeE/YedE family protein n=1 Tax=Devosia sp. TaxID=1871048 RepID=UPI0035AEC515